MLCAVNTGDYDHKWVCNLAKIVAAQYKLDMDEARQDAYFGWSKAAEMYSGDKGASFETYAGHKIKFAILDGRRSRSWCSRGKHKLLKLGEDEMPEVAVDHVFDSGIDDELALLDDDLEREVVRLTYQYDKNNRQIAEILGITQARVMLARDRAIKKLQREINNGNIYRN